MMSCSARLYANKTRRQSRKKLEHITTPQLPPYHRPSSSVNPMNL